MNIAETILSQLGGQKFIVMTGSKNFTHSNNGHTLNMKLARNGSKANHLKITLNAMDTYDMEFIKVSLPKVNPKTGEFKEGKVVTVQKFTDVYCDQLQEMFTRVTGLYTRL